MKPSISILTFILLLDITNAQKTQERDFTPSVGRTVISKIDGSFLVKYDMIVETDKTHSVRIGYWKSAKTGESGAFVTVLTLPVLFDDTYLTKLRDGVLIVSTKKSRKRVLSLSIKDLAPTLLVTQ